MSLPQTGVATTTYDQVRDWVSEAAGFDNANPLEIELVNVLMLNALQQVYAQVWDHRFYQYEWQFDILAGDYVPETSPGVPGTSSTIFDPMFKVINKFMQVSDGAELWEAESFPAQATALPDDTPAATRVEWKAWGDQFAISVAPAVTESYRVFGYRELDRILFTDHPTNPGEIVWELVDLPAETHDVYQKLILGFLYAAVDDLAASAHWIRVASDELASILNPNDGKSTNRVPQDTQILKMGGTPTRTSARNYFGLLGT